MELTKEKQIKHWLSFWERDNQIGKFFLDDNTFRYALFVMHGKIGNLMRAAYIADFDNEPKSFEDLIVLANELNLDLTSEELILLDKLNKANEKVLNGNIEDKQFDNLTKEETSSYLQSGDSFIDKHLTKNKLSKYI